ncbi:hypothetical protein [uncultured Vibrio sp.]|uniref:hypothetical protein n=1 Tax=uncultured Vibrio sp. TaxID=114054 RepID=UPI0026361343|nr:hypothetical protein [uncultured Vibrio sp.]
MAMQRKHDGRHGPMGFENDFTTEQGRRFTEVANNAVRHRLKKREVEAAFIPTAKKVAFKTVVRSKSSNPNRVRQVVWMIVIGAVSLWGMYMAG